jgi:hypothetical protein
MDGIAVGIGHHYIHKHSVDRGFERQLGRVRGLADLSGFGALLSRMGDQAGTPEAPFIGFAPPEADSTRRCRDEQPCRIFGSEAH